jgi:hypothetical protein
MTNDRAGQPSAEANALHAIMDGADVEATWEDMRDWTDREVQDFDIACTKGAARATLLLRERLDARASIEGDTGQG